MPARMTGDLLTCVAIGETSLHCDENPRDNRNRWIRTSSTTASHPRWRKTARATLAHDVADARVRGQEQRRSGIVRRLAAPDGASQLANAEGDEKLVRGVRLVRRFADAISVTKSSRGQQKRESDRSFGWFVSRLAGEQKADWFGDQPGGRNEHAEAQVPASMTLFE